MMRYIFSIMLVTLLGINQVALASSNKNIDKANACYNKELYNDALALYLNEAKATGTSSELYYNIGNTYYRLKDYSHAILYYERALLLDPSNKDARVNLDFVRDKAHINEDSGASFFSNLMDDVVSCNTSNTWAVISIVLFLLVLASTGIYLFIDNVTLRKIGFFGGIILLLICLFSMFCAFRIRNKAVKHDDAIVTVTQSTLSTSPHTPSKDEVAFRLNEGYKVHLVDSVKVGTGATADKWYNVTVSNGNKAWINAHDITII